MAIKLPLGFGEAVAEQSKRRCGIGPEKPQAEFMAFADKGERLPINRVETSYRNPMRIDPCARYQRAAKLTRGARPQCASHSVTAK